MSTINKFFAILAAGAALTIISCGGGGGGGSPSDPPPPAGSAYVQNYVKTPNSSGGVTTIEGPRTEVVKGSTPAEAAENLSYAVLDNLKDWLASPSAPVEFAGTREARYVFLTGAGSRQLVAPKCVVSNYQIQDEPAVFAHMKAQIQNVMEVNPDPFAVLDNIKKVYLEHLQPE